MTSNLVAAWTVVVVVVCRSILAIVAKTVGPTRSHFGCSCVEKKRARRNDVSVELFERHRKADTRDTLPPQEEQAPFVCDPVAWANRSIQRVLVVRRVVEKQATIDEDLEDGEMEKEIVPTIPVPSW